MSQIDNAADEITDEEVTTFVHDHPDVVALKAELAASRAERDALKSQAEAAAAKFAEDAEASRVKAVKEAAAAFAEAEIRAGRSTSHEYTDLVLFYTDAAELDHRSGETVTFADANGAQATGSRVDALKAREAKRSSHTLFSPALGDGDLLKEGERALFNGKPAEDDSAAVRAAADAVLARTSDGLAVLARRKAASK